MISLISGCAVCRLCVRSSTAPLPALGTRCIFSFQFLQAQPVQETLRRFQKTDPVPPQRQSWTTHSVQAHEARSHQHCCRCMCMAADGATPAHLRLWCDHRRNKPGATTAAELQSWTTSAEVDHSLNRYDVRHPLCASKRGPAVTSTAAAATFTGCTAALGPGPTQQPRHIHALLLEWDLSCLLSDAGAIGTQAPTAVVVAGSPLPPCTYTPGDTRPYGCICNCGPTTKNTKHHPVSGLASCAQHRTPTGLCHTPNSAVCRHAP